MTSDRELLWLGGVGVLLLSLLAGVESAGLVGGLFASGHPMTLALPTAVATVGHLATHLGTSAWPARDQRWLPETMAPALTFGGLVVVLLWAAGLLALRWLAHSAARDSARFARTMSGRFMPAMGAGTESRSATTTAKNWLASRMRRLCCAAPRR